MEEGKGRIGLFVLVVLICIFQRGRRATDLLAFNRKRGKKRGFF